MKVGRTLRVEARTYEGDILVSDQELPDQFPILDLIVGWSKAENVARLTLTFYDQGVKKVQFSSGRVG